MILPLIPVHSLVLFPGRDFLLDFYGCTQLIVCINADSVSAIHTELMVVLELQRICEGGCLEEVNRMMIPQLITLSHIRYAVNSFILWLLYFAICQLNFAIPKYLPDARATA